MPPNAANTTDVAQDSSVFKSFLAKCPDEWLKNKRLTDGAQGLWRVHDNLYDVTDYIKKHPGGRFWLEETKGTDITEAFESHHVMSSVPEELLKKYFVRKAKTPRTSPYTFKEDGFYRTLKRRAREVLKTIPKEKKRTTDFYIDCLMVVTFVLSMLANAFWSYTAGIMAGICCGMTAVAAHNYVHQKDSFRMYYSDACMVQTRAARVIHILSHHSVPNSTNDAQIYFTEPLLVFFPKQKSFLVKYVSWIYGPLLVWPTMLQMALAVTMVAWLISSEAPRPRKTDILPFLLPLTMWFLGGQSLLATLVMWQVIISAAGFTYSLHGIAGTHAHPDLYTDGDTPRPQEELDWGINQLDTVSDRVEVMGNHFWALVSFGDHALHHLFPTVDHSFLPHLYSVTEDVVKQFGLNIRVTTRADMLTGFFRQLARDKGNPNPPNLFTGKSKLVSTYAT